MQQWFVIISSHALRSFGTEGATALCGKKKAVSESDLLNEMPTTGKSCESCLRIIVRSTEPKAAVG